MIPETFNNFFLASAGIGATLVGSIFVVVALGIRNAGHKKDMNELAKKLARLGLLELDSE